MVLGEERPTEPAEISLEECLRYQPMEWLVGPLKALRTDGLTQLREPQNASKGDGSAAEGFGLVSHVFSLFN